MTNGRKYISISTLDAIADKRREEIRRSTDNLTVSGSTYYVSNSGNDAADGRSPASAWRTLERVNRAELSNGDGVLFCRGDIFRGRIDARAGVSYGAYGDGEKPRFYGWDKNLGDPELWIEVDTKRHIWKLTEEILDVGTLVFGEDELCSRKLIPSYVNGVFVCREDESRVFNMANEMTRDLDLYWHFDKRLTTKPSKNLDFPIPEVDDKSFGELYLRCDRGNPAFIYGSIEALPKRPMIRVCGADVKIDNLCIKYVGHHAICGGGHVVGLHVTNCEIGWIGGTIQHYFGTDPNYPQGSRGSVTRFGNAVEIYGGCEDYTVDGCYVYQVYDAGLTHQITTCGKKYEIRDVHYENNLIEDCVYAIEYFLDMTEGDTQSYMKGIYMNKNILRRSGYGWGQQRHNVDTPALIKGWSYTNAASDFYITENILDRSAYRMIHLVAADKLSCPVMSGNTYVQTDGGMLGQYGDKSLSEPPILYFDKNICYTINQILGDTTDQIYIVE
jgi:hypothetical protein